MTPHPSFGRLVRERRRALDLTQDELARRVGCAAITIRKIEANAMRASQQVAERLAVALALPPDERPAFVRRARAVQVDPAADETAYSPPASPTPQEIGAEDLSGRVLRGYALHERLGLGGFGAVYRALQPQIGREVAIKIILPQYADHPDFVRRFEHEAQLVARLEHPHIVPLYDYWREPGVAYLVMRLLRGGSLQTLLADGPPDPAIALRLAEQTIAALHVAHRAGVVHRDIKPANILLDEESNAYLADFGIAKDLARGSDEGTLVGAYVGSPAYSSPEQIRAETITPQTDIYALGVLLFELFTGRRPFPGRNTAELIQQHLTGSIPPLNSCRAGLPVALDGVIQRATAKVPSARYPDLTTLLTDLRAALGAGGTVPAAADRSLPAAPPTVELDLEDSDTPYKGLRAFGEGDAADFFGREALQHQLLTRLGERGELARFLAVVGPSGSGKSSAVRAGLIPALRSGALPGSEQWYIVDMVPGNDPFAALATALWRIAPAGIEADDLQALVRADLRGLLRAARLVLPPDPAVELCLVIDQFEELFTLTTDETGRVALLDSLVATVLDERSRVRVVVTLRADFLDWPLRYVDFGELLKQRSELVLPLTADELERAILGPAVRAGVALESGLTPALIAEVEGRPGALPLLQHALHELFLRRRGRALTREAYQQIGGVTGALAGSAEACYAGLTTDGQNLARQLFLRLVAVSEGAEDTRRRVRRSELESVGSGVNSAESSGHHDGLRRDHTVTILDSLLATFGAARLLTFDHDATTREPTVEVAHEALLRSWPRLRGWIDGAREDLLVQRRLAAAAAEWEATRRDPSYLATGGRLAQFTALAAGSTIALTTAEQAYVAASQAAEEAALMAERERQARELTLAREREAAQRSSAQRLRYLVGALAVFLVVALGLSSFAFQQRNAAQANLTRSEAQRLAAEAKQIIILQGNSETAALLALRSIKLGYTPQGDEAIGSAAGLEFAQHILAGHAGPLSHAIWSSDGATIFTSGSDHTIRRWDATAGIERAQVAISAGGGRLALTSSGDLLAVGRSDGVIELHNPATLASIGEIAALSGEIQTVVFSADGQRILVSGADRVARLYDVSSRGLLQELAHPAIVPAAGLSPDGRTAVTGDFNGTIRVWDLTDGAIVRAWQAHTGDVSWLDISPDGQWLLSASYDGSAKYWNLATGQLLHALPQRDSVIGADISPDGRWLATVGTDLTVHLWDASTGATIRHYRGHNGNLFTVQFSPDSQSVLTASFDATARVYLVTPQSLPQFIDHPLGVNSAAIAQDGSTVLTGDRTGVLRMWDALTGQKLWEQRAHTNEIADIAYLHRSKHVLTTSVDNTIRLWDVLHGDLISNIEKNANPVGSDGFAISSDDRYVFAQGAQGSVLWEIATGNQVRQFANRSFSAVFIPDNTGVISIDFLGGPNGGIVHIWNVITGDLIHEFLPNPGHTVFGLAITPDGKFFATGSDDGVIQLWEYGTWKEVGRFVGHSDIPWKLVFSPDGRQLLSASLDRTARLWDVATRTELRRYVHPQRLYNSIAFTPDGRYVLTASTDGTARLWDVDINDTIADLCARLQRDFTAEERAQYGIPDDGPTCPAP